MKIGSTPEAQRERNEEELRRGDPCICAKDVVEDNQEEPGQPISSTIQEITGVGVNLALIHREVSMIQGTTIRASEVQTGGAAINNRSGFVMKRMSPETDDRSTGPTQKRGH